MTESKNFLDMKLDEVQKLEESIKQPTASPSINYIILTPSALQTWEFNEDSKGVKLLCETKKYFQSNSYCSEAIQAVEYSPDGKFIIVIYKDKVTLLSEKHELVWESKESGVDRFQFSPKSNFFVSERKFIDGDEKEGNGNIVIWTVKDATAVFKHSFKGIIDKWPIFQWTDDESKMGVIVNKALYVYDNKFKLDSKLKTNCLAFSLSNANAYAVYSCPQNTGPLVQLFRYGRNNPVSQFHLQTTGPVDFKWNKPGNACIAVLAAESSKSSEFYYGKNYLYFLNTSGVSTPIKKNDEQIYDVAWNPKGNEFVMIYGYPPQAVVFNEKLEIIADYGTGTRNTILWNPYSRLICLAGVGNMNGVLEVYDKSKNKKIGYMSTNRGSRQQWSPCGRFVMSSTIHARLSVENGYQIYKYNGVNFVEKEFEKLIYVAWNPNSSNYTSRPPSPRGLKQSKTHEKKIEKQEKKYVPPHLRNKE
jgi:translation initiation factor 2A